MGNTQKHAHGLERYILSQNNYENIEKENFVEQKTVAKALLSNHTFFKDFNKFTKIQKKKNNKNMILG